jgi:ATP-dependent Clp protease, protease subunit
MAKSPMDRTIILSQSISQKAVQEVVQTIYQVNADDQEKRKHYKKYKREPIRLILNTFGGSVYDGLGLIAAIEQSKTPVHTTAMGMAMSMGLFILAAGKKRFATRYSTLMYHQISTHVWDRLEGLKQDLQEGERLEAICEDLLFRRSKLKPKHLKPYKQGKSDWFLSPEEALELKLIDKII